MRSVSLLRARRPAAARRGRRSPSVGAGRRRSTPGRRRRARPTIDERSGARAARAAGCAAEDQRVLSAFAAQVAVAYRQRRAGRGGAARSSRWPSPTGRAPRCSTRSATTCARRSPSAKAAVSSLRGRRRHWSDDDRRRAAGHRRRRAGPAHRSGHQPARPVPAAGRGAAGARSRRSGSTTSSPRALDHAAAGGCADRRRRPGRPARGAAPTPGCSSGWSPTSSQNAAALRARRTAGARSPAARTPAGSSCGSIDRGPGIPPADADAVFAAVPARATTRPRDGAGVGLGLAIARGFAEAMGGTVTAEDTPGGGATSSSRWWPPVPATRPARAHRDPRTDRRGRAAAAAGPGHEPHRARVRGDRGRHRHASADRGRGRSQPT